MGAEVLPEGGVHFRVWAPRSTKVAVELSGESPKKKKPPPFELQPEGRGYFSGYSTEAKSGSRYRYVLDHGSFPDPASRFQPDGPHGPSQIVDPGAFQWLDAGWKGISWEGQVIYEMHLGTFTQEGTWSAAREQIPELARTGVTVLEIMPIADFPNRFGWGYDGVSMFAPTRLYGTPDDFRRFVDEAHRHGLAVILDVVYNHLGPSGNYLAEFSKDYFTKRYVTDWGEALNFDGKNSGPVREFFIANARYWISEFHLDGLRLDATQQLYDESPEHIMSEITREARAAAGDRSLFIVAENEPQEVRLIRPREDGGYGVDALWNDDLHHTAMVALTGRRDAYYTDYRGTPQEFISAAKWGFLYQGQWYRWQKNRRGTVSVGFQAAHFIAFLQNHDQVANSLRGYRLHQLTSPGRWKALTVFLLLGPNTPMLFQGQEFAASSPFLYFADHDPGLTKAVVEGRRKFLSQFRSLASADTDPFITNPADESTFQRCKLNFTDRQKHADIYQMHKDLLRLRRSDPVFRRARAGKVDGAVLAPEAFVLRFFGDGKGDRLLVINLGMDLHLQSLPEPLLAPPPGAHWKVIWSSEDPAYGGSGTPELTPDRDWRIAGHSALVLA